MDAVTNRKLRRSPTPPTKRAKDRKAHGRSRVTNHAALLPGINGNERAARRFRDLVNALIADSGSLDLCSEVRVGLIRRLAAVTVKAEIFEADMINGKQVDVGLLCTLANTCMRLSIRLGLERVQKPIPGLHDAGGLLDQIATRQQDDVVTVEQPVFEHEDSGDG
jgi:hypothetical protein